MRKNFYVGYNIYPDLIIDEDWYVPNQKKLDTNKKIWLDHWTRLIGSEESIEQAKAPLDGLLPVAIRVEAASLGFDLVSTQPMNGPIGILNYLDYTYSETVSENDPWYIWKIRREMDHRSHENNRTIKKFYHVFAEPMTFFANVRVGDEVRRVEQTPDQIRSNAETFGIEYWAELEAQANITE